MLALQKTMPQPGLELREIAAPATPGPGEVLVRIEAAGICGSDLHVAEFSAGYDFMRPHLPLTLGHEFAGVVEAIGAGVEGMQIGQAVTVWPSSPCGLCAPCRAGAEQNCLDKRTLGLMRDGAFAPVVLVRAAGIFPLPDGLAFEIAALTEPLCVAHRAVETGDGISGGGLKGARVLVLGPGTIGQGIALMAQLAGAASVTVAGFDDGPRFETCRDLGLTDLWDLATEPGRAALAAAKGAYDLVFEATGRAASVADALEVLRMEGVLVLTGIHSQPVSLDPTLLVRRKLTLRGSHGSRRADWQAVTGLLAQHGERFRPMISHRLPLTRIEEGFALAAGRQASKVMIFPQQKDE